VAIGGKKVTLKATDEDGFIDFNTINYSFDDGSDETIKQIFDIDPKSGDVILRKSLLETEEIVFEVKWVKFSILNEDSNFITQF